MSDKNPPYTTCISNGWALDLDISRLHRSDTWAILDKASRPYLLMLLTVAWCESPCGSLPNNDRILCSKLGMDTTLFVAVKQDLMRGWEECRDGRLYHPVMTESVMKMMEWREKQAKKVAAWREKKSKESVSVTGNKLVTNGLVTAVSVSVSDTDINTNKEKVKKEKTEKQNAASGDAANKRGKRLPSDWSPSQALWDWTFATHPNINAQLTLDKFCDYWTAKSGRDATKTDWDGTWRNWVRNELEFAAKKPTAHRTSGGIADQLAAYDV